MISQVFFSNLFYTRIREREISIHKLGTIFVADFVMIVDLTTNNLLCSMSLENWNSIRLAKGQVSIGETNVTEWVKTMPEPTMRWPE